MGSVLFSGFFDLHGCSLAWVALGLTLVTIASVTIFLHRGQTDRALELHPSVNHLSWFWLWLTTGMDTTERVTVHRKHHAKVETVEDPQEFHNNHPEQDALTAGPSNLEADFSAPDGKCEHHVEPNESAPGRRAWIESCRTSLLSREPLLGSDDLDDLAVMLWDRPSCQQVAPELAVDLLFKDQLNRLR